MPFLYIAAGAEFFLSSEKKTLRRRGYFCDDKGIIVCMRKRAVGIDEVKQSVAALRGKKLKISVNKGRKRVVKYDGELSGVFPCVFVLRIFGDKNVSSLSCSYSDVICGDIKLKEE